MPSPYSGEELFARVKKAGELEVAGGDAEETASYFEVDNFVFDGPGGARMDYDGLMDYFASIRAAFSDLEIKRGEPVIDGNRLAVQTWITGRFTGTFTMSPVGSLEPNDGEVTLDLNNIYTLDDDGRIVLEVVRMDNLAFLRQMGVDIPSS